MHTNTSTLFKPSNKTKKYSLQRKDDLNQLQQIEPQAKMDSQFQDMYAFLRHLNNFLYYLAYTNTNQNEFKAIKNSLQSELRSIYELKDSIENNHGNFDRGKVFQVFNTNCADFNKFFIEKVIAASSNKQFFTCDPSKIFQGSLPGNIQPYVGDITGKEKMMFNKDLIIGLKLELKDFKINYRFDYDENKKLHVNIDFVIDNTTYPFAVTHLILSKGRFYVKKQGSESQQYDLVKYKFFIKMTAACIANNLHLVSKDENQFITFFVQEYGNIEHLVTSFENEKEEPSTYGVSEKEQRDSMICKLIKCYTEHKKNKESRQHYVEENTEDSETINTTEEEPKMRI